MACCSGALRAITVGAESKMRDRVFLQGRVTVVAILFRSVLTAHALFHTNEDPMLVLMLNPPPPPRHYPLHLPLSDFIDGISGSADLLQTMCRLGICSSLDTPQRLNTSEVLQCHEQGMQQEVVTCAFTMASIDNIDQAAPGKELHQETNFHGFP